MIEIQAYAACPVNVDAQDTQYQNFENLSPMPARHFEPFMLDGGSTKSQGTSILLCECQQDAILGEYEIGLQSALKSSCCRQ